jgi:hypothetical protein
MRHHTSKKGGAAMLFVAFMKLREGKMQSAVEERMQWKDPKGVRRIGEYWLTTNDPKVISIYEADSYEPILQMNTAWDHAFDINTFSAVTAEQGMDWIKKTMM